MIINSIMKTVISEDYSQHSDFLRSIPNLFADGQGEVVYSKRNEIRRFSHQGLTLMAKRYKRVNVLQRVVYTFFRPTKAERAYRFAKEFRLRGIDTPREVAYIETGSMGLFSVGYFISLETEGVETYLLLREVENFSHSLADAVAAHVLKMHSKGILHGDLNLSNFLCSERPDGYHFTMIDINRSHFRDGMPSNEECLDNLVRTTHRRDLYEYLVRSYARQRGWNEDTTAAKALQLLDNFENRRLRL